MTNSLPRLSSSSTLGERGEIGTRGSTHEYRVSAAADFDAVRQSAGGIATRVRCRDSGRLDDELVAAVAIDFDAGAGGTGSRNEFPRPVCLDDGLVAAAALDFDAGRRPGWNRHARVPEISASRW